MTCVRRVLSRVCLTEISLEKIRHFPGHRTELPRIFTMTKLPLFLTVLLLPLAPCHAAPSEMKTFPFGTNALLRDSQRDRMYCTVPDSNSVAVIDSKSLAILATIPTGSDPCALAESPDGKSLYVANSGSTLQGIAVVNLDTLAVSRYIATASSVTSLAASGSTLYTIEPDGGQGSYGALVAYNVATGTALPGYIDIYHGGVFIYGGNLALSPDGSVLYYYQSGLSPSSWFRLSTATWPTPLLQTNEFGENGQGMTMTADGQWITFVSGAPYYVCKASASNPDAIAGTFNTGPYPRAAAYSPDGTTLFTNHTDGQIEVWNANTYLQTDTITTTGEPHDLACDRTGNFLFAGTDESVSVYLIGSQPPDGPPIDNPPTGAPLAVTVTPAVEIRWNSTAGQHYQIEQRSVLRGKIVWQPLGGLITGTGSVMSSYDDSRNCNFKRYRVVPVN